MKSEFIDQCLFYRSVTLPQSTLTDPVQSGSASTPQRVRFGDSSFGFRVTPGGVTSTSQPDIMLTLIADSIVLV